MNKEGIPSRAYIAFKNEAQVATFSRAYDGHLFRDKAGGFSFLHALLRHLRHVPELNGPRCFVSPLLALILRQ